MFVDYQQANNEVKWKDYLKLNYPLLKQLLKERNTDMSKKKLTKLLFERFEHSKTTDCYMNDKFQVDVDWYAENDKGVTTPNEDIGLVWLSFKTIKRDENGDTLKIDMSYQEMQHMKRCILGDDFDAVCLFPAKEREVDTCNQYHLWIPVDKETRKGLRFPIGW